MSPPSAVHTYESEIESEIRKLRPSSQARNMAQDGSSHYESGMLFRQAPLSWYSIEIANDGEVSPPSDVPTFSSQVTHH